MYLVITPGQVSYGNVQQLLTLRLFIMAFVDPTRQSSLLFHSKLTFHKSPKLVEQTLIYPMVKVNNFSRDGFGQNHHEKSCLLNIFKHHKS